MLENPLLTLKKKIDLQEYKKQMDKYPDFLDRKKRLESIVDFDGYILTSSQFKSNKKNLHESENLLGILSRMADAELQQISHEITYCGPMDSLLPQCSDELDDHFYISKKEYPELQTQIEMVKRARTLKTHFMHDVRRVLFNTNDSKRDKNSMLWNKKTKTFDEPREKAIARVKEKYNTIFETEYKSHADRIEAASIWYYVCYGGRRHRYERPENTDFAWIIYQHLINYKDFYSEQGCMTKIHPSLIKFFVLKEIKKKKNEDDSSESDNSGSETY